MRSCGIERHNLPSAKFAPVKIDLQVRAEFVDLVRNANKVKDAREQADELYKTCTENIKERLREKNIRKIDGVLSWSEVKGRQSYDMEALLAACRKKGIDPEKYSKVGDMTSRLTLQDVGEEI